MVGQGRRLSKDEEASTGSIAMCNSPRKHIQAEKLYDSGRYAPGTDFILEFETCRARMPLAPREFSETRLFPQSALR